MPPDLFFASWFSIRCFPDFPNPFFTPIRMAEISWCKRKNHVPLTLVLLDSTKAAQFSAALRLALIAHCLYCVTGGERSPEVLTDMIPKQFMQMQKLVDAFR